MLSSRAQISNNPLHVVWPPTVPLGTKIEALQRCLDGQPYEHLLPDDDHEQERKDLSQKH